MGLLLLQGASDLNPRELFASGEQGLWLDPSQLSTMYQDSNGVTPCTAAGDPVGLIIDQSRGGLSQIGPELLVNGGFDADTDWTKGANWTIGSGVATKTGGAANNLTQTIGSTAAAWYRISLDVTRSAGTLTVSLGTSGTTYAITATGSYTFFILAGSGTQTLTLAGDSSFAGTVDNVVVRNVPGNPAYQTTSASRPTLARIPGSGRRNLLTYSEQFDNAYHVKNNVTVSANATTAPDGTSTADKLLEQATTSDHYLNVPTGLLSATGTYTASVYFKASERTFGLVYIYNGVTATRAWFNLSTGQVGTVESGASAAISDAGNGWYRCSITRAITGNAAANAGFGLSSADNTISYLGVVTSGIFLWGAQLETGSTATNLQRVGSTHDVTESGVSDLWHLVFDGSDDSLVTNAVDFSATDEMTVIAGVRKLSDAASATLVEASADAGANSGAFAVYAPRIANAAVEYRSRGTLTVTANEGVASAAPTTLVFTGQSDISDDSVTVRKNGVQAGTSAGDQGTGNYGNYQLFIGRRNQATLPFTGHIYQLIIRGKTTPTGKLLEAERFVARRTGVTGI